MHGQNLTIALGALVGCSLAGTPAAAQHSAAPAAEMSMVRIAADGKGFVLAGGEQTFVPWGFNYDHDESGRLIEDYWVDEWPKVEADFAEMKELGANTVRIHLQFGKFMKAADLPNEAALAKLGDLVKLAERTGLYLDVTGLGCYHKADVPAWYDDLDEAGRWNAQAAFWDAVAGACEKSPAVFCYDLMNEPVVPGGKRKKGDWLGPPFGDKHFVQVISLDQAGRARPDIARAWIERLTGVIRKRDKQHLITVGMVDWSLDRPGLTSGFVPGKVSDSLDFLCVHIYPRTAKLDEGVRTLNEFAAVGKPVVIEETFSLNCSLEEFNKFLDGTKQNADGWIGFYWGKTPAELADGKSIADAILLAWLKNFQQRAADFRRP